MPFRDVAEERLSVSTVKHQSRRLVFREVFQRSPVTRAAIASRTGLSQGTVKTIVDEFLESGIVAEQKDRSAPVGRKPQKVHLQPASRTFGVLHLQPGKMAFHRLDLALQPTQSSPVTFRPSPRDYRGQLALFLSEVRDSTFGPVSGIGVIVPGAYDPEGDLVRCHLMPELQGVTVAATVREELPVPVSVGEDVHVAALAEAGYPYNAVQPIFYLYAGHGVGGCFVTEGRVLTGASGMAGEIGQMVMSGGLRLEDEINWPEFIRRCGELGAGTGTVESVAGEVDLVAGQLAAGNQRVISETDAVIERLSTALGSMVCIVNPRTILIGGPYGQLGEAFLEPLREALFSRLIPEHLEGLGLIAARAGDRGMIRGAAFNAFEKWFEAEYRTGGNQ